MNWDEYLDLTDEELNELAEPATVAPMPDQWFDTVTLMLLEAGVISEDQLDEVRRQGLPEMPEEMSDQDRAQTMAFEAYDICFEDPDAARELADEAIEIDELCIDARVARWFTFDIDSEEALTAAGAAAVIGRQMVLNSADLREYDDVWMYPRMRGAVRGYAVLAETNWAHGDAKNAIDAARETLRMAPNDEVRMAPRLANWHLALEQPDGARRTFRDYGRREIAPVAFAEALMVFIKEGRGLSAKSKLLKATRAHPLVMALLGAVDHGGLVESEERYPGHVYLKGTMEEAMVWHETIAGAWGGIDGAVEWAGECFTDPRFQREFEPALDAYLASMQDLGLLPEGWDEEPDGPPSPDLRLL